MKMTRNSSNKMTTKSKMTKSKGKLCHTPHTIINNNTQANTAKVTVTMRRTIKSLIVIWHLMVITTRRREGVFGEDNKNEGVWPHHAVAML